ncbi:MAG: hypothetical protein Fur0023_18150 [Bacteroidia bacterium]
MKVGTGDGESLPFMERGLGSSKFTNPSDILKIGDGTSILGYYIATLATEYYLLKNSSSKTDSTLYELYCALYALNRLDIKAEEKLGWTGPPLLNGFLIRDDIPADFVQKNYEHFNYFSAGINNNSQSRGFMSKFSGGMTTVDSDWANYNYPSSFITQDQIYNLLYGLAFVRKFVDDYAYAKDKNGNKLYFQDGLYYIRDEARLIAKRIIDNIRDPKKYDGSSCEGNTGTGWHVRNPLNCNQLDPGVFQGYDLTSFSYPLAEIECYLVNNKSHDCSHHWSLSVGNPPMACGGAYHNIYSRTIGYTIWENYSCLPGTTANMDTRVFRENLMAVCNCKYGTVADQVVQQIVYYLEQVPILNLLGLIIGWAWQWVSTIVYTVIPGYYDNLTPVCIKQHAVPTYFEQGMIDHGPISRKVLHECGYLNLDTYNPHYTYKYLLDVAPECGIYYLPDESPKYAHFQWSSDSRCDHPNRLGGYKNDFKGEYNGIDYMLYHNLYYIYLKQNGVSSSFQNLSHVYINYNGGKFPISPTYCQNGVGLGIKAYEDIYVEKTEFSICRPSFMRAGKEIVLKPDTWIYTDTTGGYAEGIRLYIDNFECAYEVSPFEPGSSSKIANSNQYENQYTSIKGEIMNNVSESNTNNQIPSHIKVLGTNEIEVESYVYKNSIQIYPNPSKKFITISINFSINADDVLCAFITDFTGRIITKECFLKDQLENNKVSINVENLATGTYIMVIQKNQNSKYYEIFSKE